MPMVLVRGYRLCPRCWRPLRDGDLVTEIVPRWWQFWKWTQVVHEHCGVGSVRDTTTAAGGSGGWG